MTKTSNFSTEYTEVLPDDYLKVSKSGDTEDKGIKYNNFLTQVYNTNSDNVIINDYSINTSGDLELNNPNNTVTPRLINNLSYLVNFRNIPYNWQYKVNPKLVLNTANPLPIVNGVWYDEYGYRNLDVNTIGNGLVKFTYDSNIKMWKMYKLGRATITIFTQFHKEDIAGAIDITSITNLDKTTQPNAYTMIPQGFSTENCFLGGVNNESDGTTYKVINNGQIGIGDSSSVGSFTWVIYGDTVRIDEDSSISLNSLGFGSFSSTLVSTKVLNNYASTNQNLDRVVTCSGDITSTPVTVNFPSGVNTNNLDVLSKRLGVRFMLEL